VKAVARSLGGYNLKMGVLSQTFPIRMHVRTLNERGERFFFLEETHT